MQTAQLEIAQETAIRLIDGLRARLPPPRVGAGALSALLHVVLLVFLFASGERAGDMRSDPNWFGDPSSARAPGNEEFVGITRLDTPAPINEEPTEPITESDALERLVAPTVAPSPAMGTAIAELVKEPKPIIEFEETPTVANLDLIAPPIEIPEPTQVRTPSVDVSAVEQAMLLKQMTTAARALANNPEIAVAWVENGQPYTAVLTRTAGGSTDLERVIAEITTTTQGTSLKTRLTMNRLAFSQFSQVIDRWDSQVQLHDDEIVGRFHSNTAFYVGADSSARPKFSGKVTTAARNFRVASMGLGGKRRSEIFQGGFEPSTDKIDLPKEAQPTIDAGDAEGHVRTFNDDTYLVFNADGSYSWQESRTGVAQLQRYDVEKSVYLLGTRGVTLYARGNVRGHVLLYSPDRIVIEGNLRYVTDPRSHADADDYLGLIADRYVEIARPYVTGRGDLYIDAAIFARRRFVVTDIEHFRTATLMIYGSLTAGTISASEPRYATKIEYDSRFDRVRPPGFPNTNRYELAEWDGQWNAGGVTQN